MTDTKLNTADLLRFVDLSRMPTLGALAEMGVAHVEHESAAALLGRAETQAADFLARTFPDRETAFRTLRAEVAYLHEALHRIRVETGAVQERDADAFTVIAVARLSGVPVRATDDGASWRARVYDVLPGVLDHTSRSAEGRDAKLDRAIAHFRREVRESRLRLIGTLLLCLVPPLIHLFLGAFGHPNPQFADLTDIYLKLSVLPLAAMIYFSVRLRRLYASAEEDPVWM